MAKVSLKKGGKTVNGKFVANGGSTAKPQPKTGTTNTSSGSSNNSSSGSSNTSTNEQALAAQLAAVSAQAKGLGIDTSTADAMVEQTRVEGSKPFKGSTYESAVQTGAPMPTTPPPTQSIQDIVAGVTEGMGQDEGSTYVPTEGESTEGYVEEGMQGAPMAQIQGGVSGGGSGGNSTTSNAPSSAPYGATGDPKYAKVGGAYFQETPGGLLAVTDKNILNGLRNGQIQSEVQSSIGGGANRYVNPQNITPATGTAIQTMSDKFGTPNEDMLGEQFLTDPIKAIGDITRQIFESMGMDQANSLIEDISGELEDLENDRDDEIRESGDNPWLTEGVRLREKARIEQKYEDKINNRVNRLRLLEDTRNDARQQAQFALGTAISVYKMQQDQVQAYYDNAQRNFDNAVALQKLNQPTGSDLTSEMQEYMFSVEQQGFNGSFLDYKMAVAAAGRAPSSGGGGGLTPIQLLGFTNQVEDNFRANPAVQNFTQLTNFGVPSVIQELAQNPSSVNDTILMRTLAKITDPTTGVREGEYETFESATGAINRVFVLPKTWVGKGRLTDLGRQQMGALVQRRFTAAQSEYQNQYNYYNNQTSQVGATLPPPYQASQQSNTAPANSTQQLNGFLQSQGVRPGGYIPAPMPQQRGNNLFDQFLNVFGL